MDNNNSDLELLAGAIKTCVRGVLTLVIVLALFFKVINFGDWYLRRRITVQHFQAETVRSFFGDWGAERDED